ncbi:MAG: peptidase [Alphaproteobacteria bacterium]|nr:MAG: peptidase [Alphaproteobacteria bacterium]
MRVFLSLIFILWAGVALAEERFLTWPGMEFDPAIPRLEEVVGHAPGTVITKPKAAIRYLEALAAAAPDRVRIVDYARSWEGRRLVYAIIAAPETIAHLDAIKADIAKLADPRRTGEAEADAIITSLPGTVWLSYGVHGNEISSTDAGLLTAYHLLAGKDPRIEKIMTNTIVFIVPMQNPDGRARFVHHYEQALGIEPAADRLAAEHDEPWPGGRTNHYLFDLNRDWLRVTQPEIRGQIAALREWLPLVMVDAHEMSGDETYFFAPEAVPFNPHLTATQRANLKLFGRHHAAYFDRFGIAYFNREVYDAFYPGYGASWPSYYGGIAMTYEQASPRGLVFRRRDGSTLSYADAVRHHFITSLSTAEVVAENREKLYRDFYDYRRSAIAEGRRGPTRSYILPAGDTPAASGRLARLLAFHGIEVGRATADFRACGTRYAAGSYVIDAAQPEKRRLAVLLEPDVEMDARFVAAQEERRKRGLPDEIYDITAWSLPYLFNVAVDRCSDGVRVATAPVHGGERPEGHLVEPATGESVAYLVAWGEAPAAQLLTAALRAGLKVRSADEAFTLAGGETYPAGSLIFPVSDNPPDLAKTLRRLAVATGATVTGVASSWIVEGPSFGSRKVRPQPAPKVAIAWDLPTSPYSAGNTRFLLEGRYGYPVTPIRTRRLGADDLDRFDVLVLPAQSGFGGASYREVLGEDGVANLKDWVHRGGVLIGLGSAVDFLADPDVDLVSIRREQAAKAGEREQGPQGSEGEKGRTVSGEIITDEEAYRQRIAPEKASPDALPGAILRAVVDEPEHWLAAGLRPTLYAIAAGRGIYTPARRDRGRNVVRFVDADHLVASGHAWQENVAQLAFKPLAEVEEAGRGLVIAITEETTTRAYQDGLDTLFLNAVFRGAQHADVLR